MTFMGLALINVRIKEKVATAKMYTEMRRTLEVQAAVKVIPSLGTNPENPCTFYKTTKEWRRGFTHHRMMEIIYFMKMSNHRRLS